MKWKISNDLNERSDCGQWTERWVTTYKHEHDIVAQTFELQKTIKILSHCPSLDR